MATATFIHNGNTIDYTPSSDVAAGNVVVLVDLVGTHQSNHRDPIALAMGYHTYE